MPHRVALDERHIENGVPGRYLLARHRPLHELNCLRANGPERLGYCREPRCYYIRPPNVVKACNGHVFRHSHTLLAEAADRADGDQIVPSDDQRSLATMLEQ